MKKSLLTLGLLGLAGGAFAQTSTTPLRGPWTEVNPSTTNQTSASFGINNIVALSPTFAWGLAYDRGTTAPAGGGPHNTSVRSVDPTGVDFDSQGIVGSAGFQPANISVPAGVPGNTTAFCGQYSSSIVGGGTGGGGEVIRTTNSGGGWATITNPTLHFTQPAGFCNWAYAFDVNHVVTGGDPNSPSTQFEIWYTSNAAAAAATANTPTAVMWTRAQAPAPLDAEEFMLVRSYAAVGNTIWAGTDHKIGGVAAPARVLKSIDQGHTWVAQNTPLLGQVGEIAFKDQLSGICSAYDAGSNTTSLAYTTDGGTTWTLSTLPDPLSPDSVQGRFYQFGFAAIPGRGFMSFGASVETATGNPHYGVSFSPTGIDKSWKDVEKFEFAQPNATPPTLRNGFVYLSASFVADNSVPGGYRGYLAGTTRPAVSATNQGGNGGIYQVNAGARVPLGTVRSAALQAGLSVSPNPSTNGVFKLNLTDGIKAGTLLTVFDVMGRQVLSRELSATAIGSQAVSVDLSREKTGVYTLRLTTEAGIATSKLVVQ